MIQVSVIIPTFNRIKVLPRAIDSVLSQKGVSWELIVIDDGSTDGTDKLIAAQYPKIRYFKQTNQGVSSARNSGIQKTNGKWVAFLDSDDEWLPGKLEKQIAFFAAHPKFRIAQAEEIWVRKGKRVNPMKKHQKYDGLIFERCLPLCIISPSAVILEKSLLNEVGGFDESLPACEDYDLWLRIARQYPVGLLKEKLMTRYAGHADQLSSKYEAMDRFRIESLVKLLASDTLAPDQEQAARKMLREKSDIYIQGAMKRGKEKEAKEIKELICRNGS